MRKRRLAADAIAAAVAAGMLTVKERAGLHALSAEKTAGLKAEIERLERTAQRLYWPLEEFLAVTAAAARAALVAASVADRGSS